MTAGGRACPARLIPWLSSATLLAAMVLFFLDRKGDVPLQRVALVAICVGTAMFAARDGWRRTIAPAALGLVTVGAASLVSIPAGQWSKAWAAALLYQTIPLAVCLALNTFLFWRATASSRAARAGGLAHGAVVALAAYAAWCVLSAFAAADSRVAMKQVAAEPLAYANAWLLATLAIVRAPRLRRPLAYTGLATCAVALAAMLAVVAVHRAGPPMSTRLETAAFIRVEPGSDGLSKPRRLQFPFKHHNRAGYFAACAAFLGLAAAASRRAPAPMRALGGAVGVAALATLPFPMTRGALVAGAVGFVPVAAVAALGSRRRAAIALAAVMLAPPALWLALPEAHRTHLRSTVGMVANLSPTSANTAGSRLWLWKYSVGRIAAEPWLGHGYGFEDFETTLRADRPGEAAAYGGSSHAHEVWLQAAAESGIPAAMALAAFTILRMALVVAAWLHARRHRPQAALPLLLLFGLEIAVQAYGLTNHPLRRNIGLFTYGLWAVSAGAALVALRAPRAEPDIISAA